MLSDEEKKVIEKVKEIWKAILKMEVSEETDFFESGASSADVTRMVEEIKFHTKVELENTDVSQGYITLYSYFLQIYMAPKFGETADIVVKKMRGGDDLTVSYDAVILEANGMELKFPHEMFINGEFVPSVTGR